MKTLIVHPADRSTDFLKPIYADIQDKTAVTEGSREQVEKQIQDSQRIIMMGHGCPYGLFSVGRFTMDETRTSYVITRSIVPILKETENIFIWCNADQFVEFHELHGFYSGMFISEVGEARYHKVGEEYGYAGLQALVDESNDGFSRILAEVIEQPLEAIYSHVMANYGEIAKINCVAQYNADRLYIR